MHQVKSPLEILYITAAIHRAAGEGVPWDEAFNSLCNHLACADVFSVAQKAIESGLGSAEILKQVACTARICAAAGSGQCGGPDASQKRYACAAVAEHLDIALSAAMSPRPARSHPSPAASALDTIEWPLVVCDNELRLKHANRAGEIEIKSGRWLGMSEGRICLPAKGYAHTLEKLIASIIAPVAADRLHFSLPENGGRNAELWVRRLLRGSDQPGLVLISIVPELDLQPKSKDRDADESPARHLANLPLTARQRDLAHHLLGGYNLTEAAQSMNISRATANGHLKALFDLSRTRRQSDLLCWLSRNL